MFINFSVGANMQDFVLDIFRANSREQSDPIKAQATTARELLDSTMAPRGSIRAPGFA